MVHYFWSDPRTTKLGSLYMDLFQLLSTAFTLQHNTVRHNTDFNELQFCHRCASTILENLITS
jgi:hypothetical protein